MAFRLERLTMEPVLRPVETHPWERAAVFNAAATLWRNRIVLLYRASDQPFGADYSHPYVSAIGYAESPDGIHFERRSDPVMRGLGPQEARGVEDPRLSRIGGRFHMVYTAFGGREPTDFRITLATSRDLIHWGERRILLDEPNKDGALLPARIAGRYFLFHRRPPSIWLAESTDLVHWEDHREILLPRPGYWDSARIGIGPAPLRVEDGWLLIYHGVDAHNTYRLGAALLDAEEPWRVLDRLEEPILEPETDWERNGWIPNVVFACGAVDLPDRFLVFYGAADTYVGAAQVAKSQVRFEKRRAA